MTCLVCASTEEWVRDRIRSGDRLAAVRTGMAYRMLLASFDDGSGAYFEECPPHVECHALGWLFAVRDELPELADGINRAIDMLTEFRNGHTLRSSEFSTVMFAAISALADREVFR